MIFSFYLTVVLFDVGILRYSVLHSLDILTPIHPHMNHRRHDREFGGGVSHHSLPTATTIEHKTHIEGR
ncbi:hypothetical protein Plhal304r1_c033g0104891 [Plasmopara halstedii]